MMINHLQKNTIKELAKILKHAHYVNLEVRINGETKIFEADWLKYFIDEVKSLAITEIDSV